MQAPEIQEADINSLVPDVVEITRFNKSGQKQVFKCKKKDASCLVIKFVHIETLDKDGIKQYDDAALKRVLREIKIINSLKSQYLPIAANLKPGYFQKDNDCFYYYAEEYIEGSSLREFLAKGDFDIKKIGKLLNDITNAINILWENGKNIHRDIKPENIIYNVKGDVFVLIDAGIALALYETSLTPSGFIIGTKTYMSPEQLMGKKRDLDFRSDLYSLGVVTYEMLTGKHPYYQRGMSADDLNKKILSFIPPKLANQKFKVPVKNLIVIDRLLSKKPHMRYNTCQKILDIIKD